MGVTLRVVGLGLIVGCLLAWPTRVWAQGAFAGVVHDSSGGVLPGVTVEAASDALIEKTRSVVTDASGQYKIVDLRPGTYSLTFTLTGFNTLKREGLVLTSNVTLPINADLTVGAVQETVTVSGETPVVDVQNTKQAAVLKMELLETVARSHSTWATALMLPGATSPSGNGDVSGTTGDGGMPNVAIHGGSINDFSTHVDGMMQSEYSAVGTGERNIITLADLAIQEYVVETSAISAEVQAGGIRINIIPKDGGNRFTPSFLGNFTTEGMNASNLTDRLRALGFKTPDQLLKLWDVSGALGGPIQRDRLWFFTAYRNQGVNRQVANTFFETDPTKPAVNPQYFWSADLRLTSQVTPRNKVTLYYDKQDRHLPYWQVAPTRTPEASIDQRYPQLYTTIGKWTSPVTTRLLFEAGLSFQRTIEDFSGIPKETPVNAIPKFEITTGQFSGRYASASLPFYDPTSHMSVTGALSYVTGSHAFKVGFNHESANKKVVRPDFLGSDYLARYNGGVPFQVQLFARPLVSNPRINHDLGVYAQDQWKIQRLTANLGVRFDYLNDQIDAQNVEAGRFVAARNIAEINNVPNWKDVSPRLGVAYDVFGNGKTAIKGSVNRYVVQEGIRFPITFNPLFSASGTTDTRTVVSTNGSTDPMKWTLGPTTNLAFGLPILSTSPAPGLNEGWGKRGADWEYVAGLQQEVVPGLSATVNFTRRAFDNITFTNNTLISPSDFTPFTFVSPLDGTQITAYNLSAAKRGQVNNVVTFAPDDRFVFTGIDVLLNGKFGHGGTAYGGVSLGHTHTNFCTTSDPNTTLSSAQPTNITATAPVQYRYCDFTPPFTAEAQYKGIVAYPLPYGVQASVSFQSIPGPQLQANYTVTSAIAGVPLTNGSIVVNLLEPGSRYGDRANQTSLRFAKTLKIQQSRTQLFAEIFNVFNSDAILSPNMTYGPSWLQPAAVGSIVAARMLKLGVQVNF